MAQLFRMWGNTRMVVLTAMSAALYAAILIPFKVVPLIPGITEFRPANAVPVVLSFLFGPAAAWGAAFGNLIGDFFGGLGPGDLFGFVANLFYGLVPYAVWDALTDRAPVPAPVEVSVPRWVPDWLRGEVYWIVQWFRVGWRVMPVIVVASMLCATVVGWGLNALGFHPFTVLGTVVFMNNPVVAAILAPALLAVLYPRVARARLRYPDILGVRPPLPRWRAGLGVALVTVGTISAFVAGELIAGHRWIAPWAVHQTATGSFEVGVGLIPFLGVVVAGLMLL